jgi:pimeloyl-ACP methyl ester carboxylesterase
MHEFMYHQHAVRYHDLAGAGLPIVFIHGLGCAGSFDYPEVAAALGDYRRILVDLLGSGYSDSPTDFDYSITAQARCLAALATSVGLERFVLFGHSMGGALAMSLTTLVPQRVAALLLSEANLVAGGGESSHAVVSYTRREFAASGHAELVASARRDGNRLWAQSVERTLPEAMYDEAADLVAGAFTTLPRLRTLGAPPLGFIVGEQNEALERATGLMAPIDPVAVVPRAGHGMAWENPLGVAAAITTLIADLT